MAMATFPSCSWSENKSLINCIEQFLEILEKLIPAQEGVGCLPSCPYISRVRIPHRLKGCVEGMFLSNSKPHLLPRNLQGRM